MKNLIAPLFPLFLFAIIGGKVFAFDVALVPATGETTREKLDNVNNVVRSALVEQGHKVVPLSDVINVMSRSGIKAVESLEDADLIGAKLNVKFVLVVTVVPMAGQDTIEIKAYYLPEGRMELLEEIASEEEMQVVVAGILKRLITKEGLSGEKKLDSKVQEKGTGIFETQKEESKVEISESSPVEKNVEEHAEEVSKEDVEKGREEKMLEDLQRWPEKKKQKVGYGSLYKASVEIMGGAFVLLNKPVSGKRAGGWLSLSTGYVVSSVCGCEFGGEVMADFGTVDAFSLAAFSGFKFAVASGIPLYLGGRLSLGFFKNISGAKKNRMIARFAFNVNIVVRTRFMIMITPAAFTLLAFDGEPSGLYDGGIGFGFRF